MHHGTAEVQHHATVVSAAASRQAAKIPVTGVADGGAVRRRMLMDDLRADRGVHGDGDVVRGGGEQDESVATRQRGTGGERAGQTLAHPLAVAGRRRRRRIHLRAGFLGHAEGAVGRPPRRPRWCRRRRRARSRGSPPSR